MRYIKPEKAKDWDLIFKVGLVISIILSSILLVINYFHRLTSYSVIWFFSLPVLWSIIGMLLARKYSSEEQRDMHKVSNFGTLSMCGYFGAFFLVLYALKDNSLVTFISAVVVFLVLYFYSWRSFVGYLTQKNILINWNLVWLMIIMLFILSIVIALLNQFWSTLGAGLLLIIGVFIIFNRFWEKLVKQFWYSRYRAYIIMGFAFNLLSLVLWTLVFITLGFILLMPNV